MGAPIRFGTDGVRGPSGAWPIDAGGALRVGVAAARWARASGQGRVLVARDTRPSGQALAEAVLQGVARGGGVAADAGILSSPGLSAAVAALADAGVMVTASHNPASDNGFKVLGPGGRKPDEAETEAVEAWMGEPPSADGTPVTDAVEAALHAYEAAFRRSAGGCQPLRGRRFAVDLAHGAATRSRPLLEVLLEGCTVRWLGEGGGIINDGVGSEHPGMLAEAVRRGGLDGGFAVDGDGDRCVVVDERGEVVPGDALLWLLARDSQAPCLVVTVMSNAALEASLDGVEVIRTDVGDRHVAAAMRRTGARVGGEESGHVLLGDALTGGLPGGDGLLTGLRVLQAAWRAGGALSAAFTPFRPFPRRLTRVRVARRVAVPALEARVADLVGGLGGGRIFLRYSGTEPFLRVLVEGRQDGVVDAVSAEATRRCAEEVG